MCGDGEGVGVCVDARPLSDCPYGQTSKRCGCDGELHKDECAAEQAGTDLSSHEICPIAAGQFYCGSSVCNVGEHWCNTKVHWCIAEAGCEPMNCECLAVSHPGCTCSADPSGAVFLTCP